MGKLKKVLLLVLALCMMISIMSIAAAAEGDGTYWVVKCDSTTGVLSAESTTTQPSDTTYYASEAEAIAAYQAGAGATITYGGQTTYYGNPGSALLDVNNYTGSTSAKDLVLKLFADFNYEKSDFYFTISVPMTLDLNGHTFAFGQYGKRSYTYKFQKDFILKDTSDGQTGVLYGINNTAAILVGTSSAGATFTLESGTIKSETAIFDTYSNCTINVTGGHMVSYSKYGAGDSRGIVAELSSGCSLNISGGEFRSDQSAKSWDTMSFDPMGYPTKNINANSTISVTGGTFSGQAIQKYVPGYTADQSFSDTKTEITVGNYTITRSTVSSPYGAAPYDVYLYTVTPAVTYVAQIGDVKYETLQAAIAAVKTAASSERTTITLLADTNEVPVIDFTYPVQINGQGHKLGLGGASAGYAMRITAVGADVIIDNTVVGSMDVGRGINVNASGVKLVVQNNSEVYGSSYPINVYANQSGITVDNNHITITNSTIKGYCALNLWGANGVVDVTGSMLWGENNASYSPNNNEFGAIALEGLSNTPGATGYTVNVTNTTIKVTSTKDNEQYPVVFNPNSSNNTVYLTSCTIDRENATLYPLVHDEGISGNKTYVKGTTDSTTSATPVLPSGYNYCEAADGYKLVGTAVAKIGEATYYASLADAIAAANADTTSDSITITLLDNIDFSTEEYAGYKWAGSTYNPLTITRSNVTIDLDGHTISEMGNTALVFGNLLAKDGRIANITIKNGTLRAGKTDNVTNSYVLGIAGVDGVLVKDITTMGGINVYTGSKNVVIDSCNVTGTKYYTVCAQCGSDVTIKGTTYTKNTDSTVANKSMFWIQGAGTDSDMVTTENPTGAFGTSSITIESGNFTVDTSNGGVFYLGSGVKPIVKGGYFNIDPTTYVADGYAVENGTYEIDNVTYNHKVDVAPVAQIGTTKYASLADAIAAAHSGDTITMIANSAETTGVTLSKDLTIDINGKTVTFEPTPTNNYWGPSAIWFNVTVGNTLNIVDTASTKGVLKVDPAYTCTVYFMTNRGTLNLGTNSSNGPAIIIGVSTYNQNVDTTVYATTCPTNRAKANGITNYGTVNVKYADFQLSESMTGITTQANGTATYDHASFTITKGATGVQCYNGSNNTFENCTFTISEEGTGIASNGAYATITDCTINMSGEESMSASSAYGINVNKSATASTEPDVIITNLTATADYESYGATVLKVNAGHVVVNSADINAGSYGTSVYFGASALAGFENSPQMEIKGGKYYGEFTASSSKGTIELSGGKYSEDPRVKIYGTFVSTQDCVVIAEGKAVAENTDDDAENYPYTVGVAVASITKNDITTCYASLADAIDAATDGDTITLLANIDLTATVNIEKSLTIALNGNNITATNARALWVKSGEVEITGEGTISATKTENGSFSSSSSVIRVGNSGTAKAKLTIGTGVTVSTDYCYGVTVFGTNDGGVELVVNGDVTVTGTAAAISGNGNSGNKGNVTINAGAVVTATADAAIYHPQGDALTINGGSITGPVAVYQKSGTMTINGGTFTANAQAADYTPKGDGLAPTGDAIVIDNCGYPGGAPSANISGADITSANGQKIGYYVNGTSAEGTVLADSAYTLKTNKDRAWTANTDSTYQYKIGEVTYVAQIGETKYTSLQAAIAAAQSGDTIVLLEDITITGTTVEDRLIVNKTITLDMNAKTIGFGVSNSGNNFAVLWVLDGATLTITGNGTINGIDGQAYGINVGYVQKSDRDESKGNLVIESGTFKGDTSAIQIQYGTVTINGGYFEANPYQNSYRYTLNCIDEYYAANKAVYKVKGGSYFEFDPANSDSENPKGNFVVEGYKSVSNTVNEHIVYTVSEQYVEQSTTNTTTTTTTTDELGTTTTTTTTTNLAADTNDNTQYVIKVETTVTTTPEQGEGTSNTETVYQPVQTSVNTANDVNEVTLDEGNSVVGSASEAQVTAAINVVKSAVTAAQNATFTAALTATDENKTEAKVLQTTAAANAIAKAAATVNSNDTASISKAKIELQTTLKSVAVTETSGDVKATKVTYDIKPVAVILNEGGEQLGNPVELDNADIKEGESFTFTIPVPANMTATTVKVSHIGTNGYSSEIGTYHVDGTGNNRYVTVTVDHFSEFELEETNDVINGSCKITASLSLVDSININFYVRELASGTSRENYKVVYSFNGETETTVNGASWVETATGSGKYFFKVAECAASQMNDKVIFKVYYGEVEIASVSYSIRDYCESKIKNNSNQKLVELCRAVLDYGAAAQNYFNYNKANLANAGGYGLASPVTEIPSEFNALAVDRRSDISKLTASLNTVSKTEINFYITASDVTDVTVKLGTTTVEGVVTEQLSDGRYKVTIKGIAAAHLNNVYTLTFKTNAGISTLRYSALTYSYGKQSSQTAGELSLAIYNYYLKAAAYFG